MPVVTKIEGRSVQGQLPPAKPAYVLRGHTAQIHSLHFFRQNLRLLSGDADGWVVLWNIPIKRPVAVWKPHSGTVLGLSSWGDDRVITHGMDNKLCVWQLREADESSLSKVLPVEDAMTERKQPWLLHSLPVNALNFCTFAMCHESTIEATRDSKVDAHVTVLIGVPGVQDGMINVSRLPSEERVATIPTPKDTNTGMLMAIGLHHSNNQGLTIVAGYESGHACVWRKNAAGMWQTMYMHKSHSQPILSLAIAPSLGFFYTSAADAIVARHTLSGDSTAPKTVQTKHAGQQSLRVRPDEKLFATAGWDGRVRVYGAKGLHELAVLKWHKEGCYALDLACIDTPAAKNTTVEASPDSNIQQRPPTVSQLREQKAQKTHWLAAGSKDGKVSLWDVF